MVICTRSQTSRLAVKKECRQSEQVGCYDGIVFAGELADVRPSRQDMFEPQRLPAPSLILRTKSDEMAGVSKTQRGKRSSACGRRQLHPKFFHVHISGSELQIDGMGVGVSRVMVGNVYGLAWLAGVVNLQGRILCKGVTGDAYIIKALVGDRLKC